MTNYAKLLRELRDRDDRPWMAAAADAIEALQAECERLRDERAAIMRALNEKTSECLALNAELAAAQKDADRYRWLQNAYVYSESIGEWVRSLSAREFDAAIDAAMAQEKRDE